MSIFSFVKKIRHQKNKNDFIYYERPKSPLDSPPDDPESLNEMLGRKFEKNMLECIDLRDEPAIKLYTVRKGDTLRSIADKYSMSEQDCKQIISVNGLEDKKIFVGQILRIPESREYSN